MKKHLVPTLCLAIALMAASPALAQCEIDVLTNPTIITHFGLDVAITDEFIAVGAPSFPDVPGGVVVYRPSADGWIAQTVLTSDTVVFGGNMFGHVLASDQSVLAVGDSFGRVRVYRYAEGTLQFEQEFHEPKILFGWSVAVDNDLLVIGAPNADTPACASGGKVVIYRYDGEIWNEEAQLEGDYCESFPNFGGTVAAANDVVLVGDHVHDGPVSNTGAVFAFRKIKDEWVFEQTLKPSDAEPGVGSHQFGWDVALDKSGTTAIIGANSTRVDGLNKAGSAYVFEHDGTKWVETAKLTANPPVAISFFGENVAISDDGDTIIVTPLYTFMAPVFRRVGNKWIETAILPAGGGSVAISGDMAVIDWGEQGLPIMVVYAGVNDIDCNNNGVADGCDIANGIGDSSDVNGDGIPDECQTLPDLTGDGSVDVADLLMVLESWGSCPDPPSPQNCPADLTGNGSVGVPDLLLLLGAWGPFPLPVPLIDCAAATGDCCAANETPGCDDPACCETVCADDPFCCESDGSGSWDMICMHAAREHCGCEPPAVCGEVQSGSCCTLSGNGSPGCDDPVCCTLICDWIDPYCCDAQWDDICAAHAYNNCPQCVGEVICPGAKGDCCEFDPLFTPGCKDLECCIKVCAARFSCCDAPGVWDPICVQLANQLCDTCDDGG